MRTNSSTHLSVDECETLSLGRVHGHSLRIMARVLRWAPSTMSRKCAGAAVSSRHCTESSDDPKSISHDGCLHCWTPGSGSMSGPTWVRGVRPNRLPGVSDARTLSTGGNVSRRRRSRRPCMCCHEEPYLANCWPHCGRPAKHADLGRAE